MDWPESICGDSIPKPQLFVWKQVFEEDTKTSSPSVLVLSSVNEPYVGLHQEKRQLHSTAKDLFAKTTPSSMKKKKNIIL